MIVDLLEALPAIERDGRYRALCKQVRLLWALYTIQADFEGVQDALSLLQRFDGPDDRSEISADIMAASYSLMSNAIIMYCRAVHSNSTTGRYRVDVTEGMSFELKKKYVHVTRLRDKVIAHHGWGGTEIGGPWLTESMTIEDAKDRTSVRYAYVRLANSAEAANALEEVLAHSKGLIDKKGDREARGIVGRLPKSSRTR